MTRIATAAVAACLTLAPLLGLAKDQPDATVDLTAGSVGVGVGVNWGKGTLHYQGRSIPIAVKGLSVGDVGARSITASGEVYHLTQLSDFAGNYTAVGAGATLAGGGSVAAMRNDHGVVIELRSTTKGVNVNLGVDGMAVSLKE
jgi:hypothetical protein